MPLREQIGKLFNLAELKDLCLTLGLDYENLGGAAKNEIIRELLLYLNRRGEVPGLVEHLYELRPHIDWAFFYVDKPYSPDEPPYKGMVAFTEADSDHFFGRRVLTAEVIHRVHQGNFLILVGASGSGKSSLVHAGVLPALRSQRVLADGTHPPSGSVNWCFLRITPSADPFTALAFALSNDLPTVEETAVIAQELQKSPARLSWHIAKRLEREKKDVLFLVVDQFEELFARSVPHNKRQAFIDSLLTALEPNDQQMPLEGRHWKCLICVRDDYYRHCGQYANLRQALNQHQLYIGAMNHDEIRQAIEGPAQRHGLRFQPGLVSQMLADIGANGTAPEPGILPLLSHALLETWKGRLGRTLTLAGYEQAGRIQGALSQTADTVFADLTESQQQIARQILARLTRLGEPGTLDSRRSATRVEVKMGLEGTAVDAVLEKMVRARLLITRRNETVLPAIEAAESDQATIVEVAHEALIRNWPKLRKWLDENREGLLLLERIRRDARIWQDLKRDPDALYRGLRLAQAQAWSKTWTASGEIQPGALERSFLEASEKAEKKRIRRRQVAWGASGIFVTVLLLTLGVRLGRATQGQLLYRENRVWSLAATEDTFLWGTGDVGIERYRLTLPTGPGSGLQCAVEALASDGLDASHLYAAVIGQGIYHSTDGGENWDPLNTPSGVAVEERNETQDAATSCSEAGPLPGNVLNAMGQVTDLDVVDTLLVMVVRKGTEEPTAFISWDEERAQSIEHSACSKANVPGNVTTTHIGQDGFSIYAGARDGLYKGAWQPGQLCWRWEQAIVSEQVVALEGVADRLFWVTTASEVFYWEGGATTAVRLTTLSGRPHALAARPDATAVYVLEARWELLGPLTSIQSVLAVTPDGEIRRLGWQPGFAFDLLAVPNPSGRLGTFWVLMAHTNGVYLFTDEASTEANQ